MKRARKNRIVDAVLRERSIGAIHAGILGMSICRLQRAVSTLGPGIPQQEYRWPGGCNSQQVPDTAAQKRCTMGSGRSQGFAGFQNRSRIYILGIQHGSHALKRCDQCRLLPIFHSRKLAYKFLL